MGIKSALCALSLAVLAPGCGAPQQASEDADLVAHVLSDHVLVTATTLSFPRELIDAATLSKIDRYEAALRSGEDAEQVLFVDGRNSKAEREDGTIDFTVDNPLGFKRRALSVSRDGDLVVITTEQVSTAEVMQEAAEHGVANIVGNGGKLTTDQLDTITEFSLPKISASGSILAEEAGFKVNLKNAELQPSLRFSGDLGLSESTLGVDVMFDSTFTVALSGTGAMNEVVKKQIYNETKVVSGRDSLPVTVRLTVDVECSIDANAAFDIETTVATTGARVSGIAAFGRSDGLNGTVDAEAGTAEVRDLQVSGGGTARAVCRLTPQATFFAFDEEGPTLSGTPIVDIQTDVQPPVLSTLVFSRFEGHLSGSLEPFHRGLGELDSDISTEPRVVLDKDYLLVK